MFRDISREAAVAKSNAGLRTRSFIYAANNRLVNFQAPNSSATDRDSANPQRTEHQRTKWRRAYSDRTPRLRARPLRSRRSAYDRLFLHGNLMRELPVLNQN